MQTPGEIEKRIASMSEQMVEAAGKNPKKFAYCQGYLCALDWVQKKPSKSKRMGPICLNAEKPKMRVGEFEE